jgi:hypothetical protein
MTLKTNAHVLPTGDATTAEGLEKLFGRDRLQIGCKTASNNREAIKHQTPQIMKLVAFLFESTSGTRTLDFSFTKPVQRNSMSIHTCRRLSLDIGLECMPNSATVSYSAGTSALLASDWLHCLCPPSNPTL